MYSAFKFMHLLGVVLLLGNVTASAVWKVFANRTGNAVVVAFSQKLVSYTDWSLTLGGVVPSLPCTIPARSRSAPTTPCVYQRFATCSRAKRGLI